VSSFFNTVFATVSCTKFRASSSASPIIIVHRQSQSMHSQSLFNQACYINIFIFCRSSDSAAEQHVLDLAEILHQFQQEEHLCDVTLEAKDGQMKAHSIVLAAASSMLRTVLSESRKSIERVILMPWLMLYELKIVVYFIYTGKVVVPAQYALPATLPKIISTLTELGLNLPGVQNR